MADLFGAPEGQIAAIETQGRQAQAQALQLQNLGLQRQMADQDQMRQIVSNLASEKGTPVEMLNKAGDRALRGGMLDQAEKAFSTAGLMQQRAAQAADYQALAESRQYTTEMKRIDAFAGLADMFPDTEQGWNAVKTSYAALHPELTDTEKMVFAAKWRPGMARQLKQLGLSAKEQMELEFKQRKADLEEVEAGAKIKHWERQDAVAAKRAATYADRTAAIGKATGAKGATAAGIPTLTQQEDAGAVIDARLEAADMPELSGQERTNFAREVASTARLYTKEGVDWDDALQQAYDDHADRLESSEWFRTPLTGRVGGSTKVKPKREATPAPAGPKIGAVEDGYRYKGGDPSKQSSWEKVK